MTRTRHALSLLAALLLAGGTVSGVGATASAAPVTARASEPCPHTSGVQPTRPATPPTVSQRYFQGDWRLGPARLPTGRPFDVILRGYRRLDHQPSSAALLRGCWQNLTGGGNWWYPQNNGFIFSKKVRLTVNQRLDRFGSDYGGFLAPAGAPYAGRALPPSNLDTIDPAYPHNYHVFQVIKSFSVDGGPARPWFGQPGRGLQYAVNGAYLPGMPTSANVLWLINEHYLKRLN
jgi:hypothetical protein